MVRGHISMFGSYGSYQPRYAVGIHKQVDLRAQPLTGRQIAALTQQTVPKARSKHDYFRYVELPDIGDDNRLMFGISCGSLSSHLRIEPVRTHSGYFVLDEYYDTVSVASYRWPDAPRGFSVHLPSLTRTTVNEFGEQMQIVFDAAVDSGDFPEYIEPTGTTYGFGNDAARRMRVLMEL